MASPVPAPGEPTRRIIVLRAGAIGDTIVAFPALAALRRAFPGASLTLVGNPAPGAIAIASSLADEVLPFDAPIVTGLFADPIDVPADLVAWAKGFDFAIGWQRDPDSAPAATLRALGLPTLAAPSLPPVDSPTHVADHLLETLAPLGVVGERGWCPELIVPPNDAAAGNRLWERLDLPPDTSVVAIHPGSGGARKNWPAERFATVLAALREREVPTVIFAGPADDTAVEALRWHLRGAPPPVLVAPTLGSLAACLRRCAGYLGNDSGVSHLAAAFGVPTVALFGPTDPARWAPRGPRVQILWAGGGDHGLDGISVDAVLDALNDALAGRA